MMEGKRGARILKKLIFHPVLTHASRRAHHVWLPTEKHREEVQS